MKINLATWDRWVRFFIGVVFTAWAVAGGPWWAYIGVYLVLSASWGFCLVYAYLRFRTAQVEGRPNPLSDPDVDDL